MSDLDYKKKLESAEFLLRNYQVKTKEDMSELLDQLWWIIVESKYRDD